MRAYIMGFNKAREFQPTRPTMAIRIFQPGARTKPRIMITATGGYTEYEWLENSPAVPFPRDLYKYVFEYEFNDVDLTKYSVEAEIACRKRHQFNKFINKDIAEQIIMNFESSYRNVDDVLFHCTAGVSRSPAVALALDKIFDVGFEWSGRAKDLIRSYIENNTVGNRYVYNMMLNAAGI